MIAFSPAAVLRVTNTSPLIHLVSRTSELNQENLRDDLPCLRRGPVLSRHYSTLNCLDHTARAWAAELRRRLRDQLLTQVTLGALSGAPVPLLSMTVRLPWLLGAPMLHSPETPLVACWGPECEWSVAELMMPPADHHWAIAWDLGSDTTLSAEVSARMKAMGGRLNMFTLDPGLIAAACRGACASGLMNLRLDETQEDPDEHQLSAGSELEWRRSLLSFTGETLGTEAWQALSITQGRSPAEWILRSGSEADSEFRARFQRTARRKSEIDWLITQLTLPADQDCGAPEPLPERSQVQEWGGQLAPRSAVRAAPNHSWIILGQQIAQAEQAIAQARDNSPRDIDLDWAAHAAQPAAAEHLGLLSAAAKTQRPAAWGERLSLEVGMSSARMRDAAARLLLTQELTSCRAAHGILPGVRSAPQWHSDHWNRDAQSEAALALWRPNHNPAESEPDTFHSALLMALLETDPEQSASRLRQAITLREDRINLGQAWVPSEQDSREELEHIAYLGLIIGQRHMARLMAAAQAGPAWM